MTSKNRFDIWYFWYFFPIIVSKND